LTDAESGCPIRNAGLAANLAATLNAAWTPSCSKLEPMALKNSPFASGADGTGGAAPDVRAFLEQFDHDLRTPIGTMAAAIDLLGNEPPGTPSHAETIAVLQRQLGRLHSLTETLREFSQGLGR
jgi:signal transduction histidine kinase